MIDHDVRRLDRLVSDISNASRLDSELVKEEGVRHFLEVIPGAEYVDVGGARHMVVGDNNDAFADAVLAFLARLEQGTGRPG